MIRLILATWRLTLFLYREDGPWDIAAKLRDAAGVRYDEHSEPYADSPIGKMFLCFWCTSFWAAVIICLLSKRFSIVDAFAASAGAIFIEKAVEELSSHGAS